MKTKTVLGLVAVFCALALGDAKPTSELESYGRQFVEQGRTMVHHAVKRFMIILPAIFFKLGIAFTLLVVVALAAVNNGFIGFLLLVVGLSSVLARLQDSGGYGHVAVPYISPPYHQHAVWDRSGANDRVDNTKAYFTGQTSQYSPALANYYAKYTTSNA